MKTLTLGTATDGPFTVPIEIVTEKVAFLGMTGSGKTYSATKMAELMLGAGAQIVAIDPVGVWRGLRMGGDLEIYIFGGQSGDFPLESTGGALVAELIVERGISAVLDVSQFGTDTELRRFAYDFATRFFHLKKTRAPSAVHLFLEECQEFIPQDKQHGDEKMLHAFQRLWKLGRNFGIGGSLISQRPQDVNKKALNMSGTLFVHRMTAPGDRDVISKWVDEKGIEADVGAILPRLKQGCPHVWSPDFLKVSEGVAISAKKTADISSTPKVGGAAKAQAITPIDADKISRDMAATIERAKENDPAELKRRIVELQKQIATKPPAVPAKEMIREIHVIDKEALAVFSVFDEETIKTCAALHDMHKQVSNIAMAANEIVVRLRKLPAPGVCVITPHVRTVQMRSVSAPLAKKEEGQHAVLENGSMPKAERAILRAIAQRHPRTCSRAQASLISGYSITSSSFSNALSALRSAGLIDGGGDDLRITDAGMSAAGPIDRPTSSIAIQSHWLGKLGKAERSLLAALINSYPHPLTKENLSVLTGYSETSSSFSNALSALRSAELITRDRDPRATEILFEP